MTILKCDNCPISLPIALMHKCAHCEKMFCTKDAVAHAQAVMVKEHMQKLEA